MSLRIVTKIGAAGRLERNSGMALPHPFDGRARDSHDVRRYGPNGS